jgi:hypothetical protein
MWSHQPSFHLRPPCQTTFASVLLSRATSIHHPPQKVSIERAIPREAKQVLNFYNQRYPNPLFAKGIPIMPTQPAAPAPAPARHDMSVILVTGSYDHEIRFWEAWSGICSRTIARSGESGVRHSGLLSTLPFSPHTASKSSSNLSRVRPRVHRSLSGALIQ